MIIVNVTSAGRTYSLGENTALALASATAATLAANSATAAGRYFVSQAAGEAGSTTGQFFSHPDGAGGLVYRERTGGGSTIIAMAATKAQVDAKLGAADLAASGGSALMNWIAAGTGAVAETVQAVLRRLPSIKNRGAAVDGATSDTTAWNNEITAQASGFTTIPVGTTRASAIATSSVSIRGAGQGSVIKANGTDAALVLGHITSPTTWVYRVLRDVLIDGNVKASDGITFRSGADTEVSGRWSLYNVTVTAANRAIYKPNGNIGNNYYGVSLSGNDYGFYSVGQTSPLMHGGCDVFHGGHIEGSTLAAVFIDSAQPGTGGTALRDMIIEGNLMGVFVYNWADSYTPLVLDHVWFELNGRKHPSNPDATLVADTNVTINGVSYVTRDLYLRNTALAVLINGRAPETQLVNSRLLIQNSSADDTSAYIVDADSVVYADNMHFNGGQHPIMVRSVAGARRVLGNFATAIITEPRVIKAGGIAPGTVLFNETFAEASVDLIGTATIGGVVVADGRIFDSCQEFTIPASHTELIGSATILAGKWYVWTMDFRHVSGTLSQLDISIGQAVTFAQLASLRRTGEWQTLAAVGKCDTGMGGTVQLQYVNGAAGAQVIRKSAYQMVQFDTEQQALDFLNARIYAIGNRLTREIYGTAAPSTGAWEVGDRIWFTNVAAAGSPGAICTTAGTPGSWKNMAALAA